MFSMTLNGKKYQVDYVRAIALREIKKPLDIVRRLEDKDTILTEEEMDVLVKWFCLFLGGEIDASEIYQHYPADRLTYDISLAAMSCQMRITEALKDFPTRAATRPQKNGTEA